MSKSADDNESTKRWPVSPDDLEAAKQVIAKRRNHQKAVDAQKLAAAEEALKRGNEPKT